LDVASDILQPQVLLYFPVRILKPEKEMLKIKVKIELEISFFSLNFEQKYSSFPFVTRLLDKRQVILYKKQT